MAFALSRGGWHEAAAVVRKGEIIWYLTAAHQPSPSIAWHLSLHSSSLSHGYKRQDGQTTRLLAAGLDSTMTDAGTATDQDALEE